MTWKSHTLANGALAMALTGRPVVAAAAMLTAAVPDQLEGVLPFARHRGLSHWLGLWATAFIAVVLVMGGGPHAPAPWTRGGAGLAQQAVLGLALGPLLHVVLDGFSAAGVPLGPFCRRKLRLGLYRTSQTRRVSLDVSEVFFVAALLIVCTVAWKMAWMH